MSSVRLGYEQFWVDIHPFLKERGYSLRRRYDSHWLPSWRRYLGLLSWIRDRSDCEDYMVSPKRDVLDATRNVNACKVVLKRISAGSEELKIALHLSSTDMRSNPYNRAVPILEVVPITGTDDVLLVMPYLRTFSDPPFHCPMEVGEVLRQFLQGLVFMHEQGIAHGDIGMGNLMMDESAVVPGGSHFCRPWTSNGIKPIASLNRCAVGNIQYYYIDYGLSTRHKNKPDSAAVLGMHGQVKTLPESSNTVPYNPFKADVYQLGHTILEFIQPYQTLDVFFPLCQKMMQQNPLNRPNASEALAIFEKLYLGLCSQFLLKPFQQT